VQDENLKLVRGELTDAVKVSEAGADAVLSGLGAVRGGPAEIMVPAAKSIVPAMQQHGVQRLIWASGAGVPDLHDQPALMNKIIGFMLKLTAGRVLEDSLAGIEIIQSSGLDWTIARGPMLTDAPGSGNYRVGYVSKEMGRTLSREDFADFMIKQLRSDEWLHKMPAISDL
jgi:putative NADH-flavin reductase